MLCRTSVNAAEEVVSRRAKTETERGSNDAPIEAIRASKNGTPNFQAVRHAVRI